MVELVGGGKVHAANLHQVLDVVAMLELDKFDVHQ